jgi:hypothetical protein
MDIKFINTAAAVDIKVQEVGVITRGDRESQHYESDSDGVTEF